MAKRISKKDLESKLGKGWEVDSVVKPTPKKKPKPLLKEQVAETFDKSSVETTKAVTTLTEAMTKYFDQAVENNSQIVDQIIKVNDKNVVVQMPPTKKKRWKFNVQRDYRGFIESITAEEIN